MRLKIACFFIFPILLFACGTSIALPVSKYYNYDKDLPLHDSINLIDETIDFKLYKFNYRSVHYKKVTGLLSVPNNANKPVPVIILLHGLGDKKTVDYIEYGNDFLLKNGYAVLRIDISNHGERFENEYEFDFTGKNKYWTRNIISQTVFDLRRAVDFINSRKELDSEKIGFFGISLGGITGIIFCGVENRVKVPVFVLAGGQMNLLFGKKALSATAKDYVSIIEPINYVKQISPRPLLMLNAEEDEIVPPIMSKLLYNKAKKPKKIIWYPAKHHTIPQDKIYQKGVDWFDEYLNK